VSKSDYPYAPDEFDVPAPEGAPVGVFRAPRSGWSKTWPFLLVAVIFAGLGVGGVYAVSGGFAKPGQVQAEQPAAPAGDDGAEEPPAEDAGTEEPPADDTAVEEPPAAEEPAAPAVDVAALVAAADKGALVRVMNDDGPEGESRVGKSALEAKGFTNVKFEPYPGDSGASGNAVWYTENRKETALAVAAALGIPAEQATQQTLREGDVMVIVKTKLTPAP
jgi:hypothetical protein